LGIYVCVRERETARERVRERERERDRGRGEREGVETDLMTSLQNTVIAKCHTHI